MLLEDVDGDGNIELVLGLTDRVVRMYRWMQSATGGRLVCLFKWECANQMGGLAISHNSEGAPKMLVTQPGGTIMRINPEISSGVDQSERLVLAENYRIDLFTKWLAIFGQRSHHTLVHPYHIPDTKPNAP